ncbi:MAG: Na/Pi cotransporter family protein [Paludibacteraceae bacterium]|nr:Na/Pi cotransporter family protein [Paludibacteraceae bacterium]MBO7507003.1 Na/Pi cotransporter family protein [Paludibacteraceae bacterium]
MDYLPLLVLAGSVALLMYGMKVMSEGLQKMAGSKLRQVLGKMTTNRFTGLLTGAFITTSIQSSTATTVMTVSFVSAGLLTLTQAISVIMGANIGTTATAWIMVLGGSGNYMQYVVYAAIVVGIACIYSNKRRNLGEFIMGLALLLLGLTTLSANAKGMHLDQNVAVQEFFGKLSSWGYGSYLLFLFIGGVLTCSVQSSAAIMAITMTLCSAGVLDIYMGIALVMGENIGTTVTSNVVALSASTQARRAAMAHMVFNVFGVIWIFSIFPYFVDFVCWMVGCDPHSQTQDKSILTVVLAAFHTSFNVCNVLILIWFIKPLERLVCKIISPKANTEEDESRLTYIGGGLLSTAELSILEAKKEVNVFATRCHKMFRFVPELLHTEKGEDFNKLFTRIEKYENITDNMEVQIADYLNKVSEGRLSAESKTEIQHMMKQVSELESIGDSCYNLARTIRRRRQNSPNEDFTEKQYEHVHNMFELVDQSLTQMEHIVKSPDASVADVNKSMNVENEINNYRKQLKNQNVDDINNRLYNYQLGVYYMDLISECEKLGDYVVNVIECTGLLKK